MTINELRTSLPGQTRNEAPTTDFYDPCPNIKPDVDSFYEGLKALRPNANILLNRYVKEELMPMLKCDVPSICDQLESASNFYPDSTIEELLVYVMFTDADIKTVEKATRGQSTNRLWHLYRQGLITASRFYEVTHMRESTDPSRIVNDLLANKFGSSSGNLPPSLKWGIENEAVAVKLFKKKHRLNHIHFKFYDMGLVVDSQSNFLGATPDGIIDCSVCGKFLIEVKCPWSMRYYEPDTAATANKCINDKGTW